MKVLHVISSLDPDSGGPTAVVRDILKFQSAAGAEVHVATTDRGNPVSRILTLSKLREQLPSTELTFIHAFSVEFSPLLVSLGLYAWLRDNVRNFDLVHIHGIYRFPNTIAGMICRRYGVPYIVSPHGSLDPFLYRQSANSILLKRVYEFCFEKRTLRNASAIHFTTHDERRLARLVSRDAPFFIAPNGIDISSFHIVARNSILKRIAPSSTEGAPIILFLGRINFKKGLNLLIPAFATVLTTFPRAQLVIAGPDSGGYLNIVRDIINSLQLADKCHVIGGLSAEQTRQIYLECDLFVLPSYTENFGITVIEAMASGLPVLISDQVNIHTELSMARVARVARCDAAEIAECMTEMLDDRIGLKALAESGKEYAELHFDWTKVAARYLQCYSEVVLNSSLQ